MQCRVYKFAAQELFKIIKILIYLSIEYFFIYDFDSLLLQFYDYKLLYELISLISLS